MPNTAYRSEQRERARRIFGTLELPTVDDAIARGKHHGGVHRSLDVLHDADRSEIQAPMAVVILCGLASSTALNMFVVPALYRRFGALARRAG